MARKKAGPTRAHQRYELLKAAADVALPPLADVCVVGGGAAGLVAAIVAAEAGAHTVVLESQLSCGRSILATGNGRCNFANTHLKPRVYNDPAFVEATCGPSWLEDIFGFFSACGLAWNEEAEGRLYPLSRQAASVRNVLLARTRAAGVVLAPARTVRTLTRGGRTLEVAHMLDGEENPHILQTKAVVFAAGGTPSEAYTRLGLASEPSTPLLCPLACEGPMLALLDGRRVRATARLLRSGEEIAQESGEILFRTYGLSGIAVFNLSRHACPGDTLVLDLMPALDLDEARCLAKRTLDGILDPLIAQALIQETGSTSSALDRAQELTYTVLDRAETDRAQVRRGGLLCDQFDPTTLQATAVPGFFACGEALNVDGPCGGYNLAWAWKSGMVAGETAAAYARTRR